VGTYDAWEEFEQSWNKVLEHWNCSYLHMVDAGTLRGEYSGWTKKQVNAFLGELFNKCFSPIGRGKKYEGQFYGVSCTVNLEDYRNIVKKRDMPVGQSPEAICVRTIIYATAMGLPDNPDKPLGKDGELELYFDNNEPFLHEIEKMTRNISRKQLENSVLGLISSKVQFDSRKVIGLQAADFLAWQTNRSYACNPERNLQLVDLKTAKAAIRRILATRGFSEYYDCKRLERL
jgi:hypothetical protein